MEERSFEDRQVSIRLESTELSMAPGDSVTIPVAVHNLSGVDGAFELSVRGIPGTWASVPSPVIRLATGERREVALTIQPPAPPHARAGRYQLVIRVASQEAPHQVDEATCTLTVAALEVPGRIGILLASTEFSVAPGDTVAIPLVLSNQGLERDVISLSVEGIPTAWVYASVASAPLAPGEQQEVTLNIQPPRSGAGGAGRHPFQIRANSQAVPGQVTAADCILTVATFSQFGCELRPQRIEAGEPARVTVENQGNIPEAFSLTWQSPEDALEFEPAPKQELQVPPGEVAMAEFSAKPRSRPLFGRERFLPFTTRIQSAAGETRNLSGEVLSKPIVPGSVLTVILVAILVIAAIVILLTVWGGSPEEGAPPDAPAATATPGEEQPAPTEPPTEPTQPPEPTEPPPEPTQPPAPTEPPGEPPPEAGQLPSGPEEGESPCAPLAGILFLAPLLVLSKRGRQGRSTRN